MSNTKCHSCTNGVNTINGRYCKILKIIVEYRKSPPCQEEITIKIPIK